MPKFTSTPQSKGYLNTLRSNIARVTFLLHPRQVCQSKSSRQVCGGPFVKIKCEGVDASPVSAIQRIQPPPPLLSKKQEEKRKGAESLFATGSSQPACKLKVKGCAFGERGGRLDASKDWPQMRLAYHLFTLAYPFPNVGTAFCLVSHR
jgi:hypothetical protein